MEKRSGFIPFIVGIAFALVSQTSFAAPVSLRQASFSPGQPHATLLSVSAPCSLTVRVTSPLGAGIVLEDRMTGVVARDGNPGERDGRIDYTLDAGEYRITVLRGEGDAGPIRLTAEPLAEANTPNEQALLLNSAEGSLIASTLKDGEQKSFWVRHEAENSPLILEAAGRSLRSVQLWKDGQLLTADRPFLRTIAPDPGKSLRYADFNFAESSRNLPPGDYLVVFLGGETLSWEQKGSEQPLYIRKGMKSLGSAWVGNIQIGPFGFEHFTADGYFRAEAARPETSDAGLSSGQFPGYGQGSRWNSVGDEGSTGKDTPLVSVGSSCSDRS